MELGNVVVWVDYISIPQECKGFQALMLDTLMMVSSMSHAFVAIVPESVHANTNQACGLKSYHTRCWCRAEMLSHWASNGIDNMFYAFGQAKDLQQMTESDAFLKVLHVFDGECSCCLLKHPGDGKCDKERIKSHILGL